jgi:aspartyl-tRNA(Asn)/glutamyl-tRNA(Gln) amidotransferase subunit C
MRLGSRLGREHLHVGPDRPTGAVAQGPRIAAMPEITRDEVAHLADLARIDLDDAELDHLAPQLSVILESVASINGVAGDDVPPTSHALPLTNVFRDDVVTPGLTAEQALAGAPEVDQQRFSVPRILGDEQ